MSKDKEEMYVEADKYRKKPIIVDAHQWFKNGDHPLDYSKSHHGLENDEPREFSGKESKVCEWEGGVVRYFRHPDVSGDSECDHCGKTMHAHGWIDTLEGGHIVCPGDWIITGIAGEHYPCKPDIFKSTYEQVVEETTTLEGGEQLVEAEQEGWSNFAVQILEYLVSLYNGIGGSIVGTNADLPDLYMLPREHVEELLGSLKGVSQSLADEMGLEITWEESITENTSSDGAVDVELLEEESNDA